MLHLDPIPCHRKGSLWANCIVYLNITSVLLSRLAGGAAAAAKGLDERDPPGSQPRRGSIGDLERESDVSLLPKSL